MWVDTNMWVTSEMGHPSPDFMNFISTTAGLNQEIRRKKFIIFSKNFGIHRTRDTSINGIRT